MIVGRDANIDHVALQERRQGTFHLATLYSRQEAGSRFGSHSIAMGEGLARLERFPDCRHGVFRDDPEAGFASIRRFLLE